ncbi:hypothetical protein HC761_02330 [bacterium]|nr:hypothetical protein [bacterium]
MAKVKARTPEYWDGIKKVAIGQIDRWRRDLLKLFGPTLVFKIEFSPDPKRFSPTIRQKAATVTIDVPEMFLLELDEAVKWMIEDVPFHDCICLAKAYPEDDISVTIWMHWLIWILNHELAHFYAGHLTLFQTSSWAEFEVAETCPGTGLLSDPEFRRALELDADIFAAQAMFYSLGRMTKMEDWKILYGPQKGDVAKFALCDIGLFMVPLCLELGHMAPKYGPSSTHPDAKARLLGVFPIAGWDVYFRTIGQREESHFHAFMEGIYEGVKNTFHIKESIIHKPFEESEIESARQLLLSAGMHKKTLVQTRR